MKKISPKQRQRLKRIQRIRERNSQRRKNYSYVTDNLFTVEFPKIFSLSKNYGPTIRAISQVKDYGNGLHLKPTKLELDLSNVQDAAVAAILVLSSEIDRILSVRRATSQGIRVVPKKLQEWRSDIQAKLDDLGFFGLLDIQMNVHWPDELLEKEFNLIPMAGAVKFSPPKVGRLVKQLRTVAEFFDQSAYVYEAMIEATHNAIDHAYPQNEIYKYHIIEGAWWSTASYSGVANEVRVVVFDQGVGIPQTLQRWSLWENVRRLLSVGAPASVILKDHARMIAAAVEVSRTSKNRADGRGQGLSDVLSPVAELGQGRVRILSGSGGILYKAGEPIQLINLEQHIGGTLIEWCLPVTPQQQEV